jgi:hypothetical protein
MSYYKPVNTIASVGTASTPIPVTIASPTEPTTRENGGTLRQGDNWYNTSTAADYIWITDDSTAGGSWKIIGTGASGGGAQPEPTPFTGGFVPNSIFVGNIPEDPNLILNADGSIAASQQVSIVTPIDTGVALSVANPEKSIGFRVLGDGTIQTGMKTGDLRQDPFIGVQINPEGTIEMGGSTLSADLNSLFFNGVEVALLENIYTNNLLLVNPTTDPNRGWFNLW